MRDLVTEDFGEFKWLPFVIGILGLLFLRAAVLGKVSHLVDVTVLYLYFSLFALWSFAYKMYRYGHDLDPKAAVKVEPFLPPLFGYKKLANFEVYSYPQFGSYALALASLCLLGGCFLAYRQWRRGTEVS
jgi:O-antigen/teichoic acid export membrane protein